MPEYSITIGGTERQVRLDGLDLARVSNGIDTLTCIVQSEAAAYRPSIRDEVLFKIDGSNAMGGIITSAEEMAWGGPALTDILTRISVTSFDIFAKYRYYTGTLAAGTLKSQLTTLVALLSSYGVSLHASQVNGPNVEALDLTRARLDNILTQLSETTGYVWFITADKELRMVDPASTAAPFDILDSGTVYQEGDIRVERTLDETYANRVILVINGAGPQTSTETFTAADGVSAGGYTTFTAKYPASQSISDPYPNQLIIDGSYVSAPIGFGATQLPTDSNWYWDYTASPAELVYPESSGQIFPDASSPAEVITITYAIGFPYTVQADNAADQALYGIKEVIIPINQALTIEAAQALADAMVDSRAAVKTKVTYSTRTDGLAPNMAQTITVSKRNVDDSFYITDVRMSHTAGDHNESMLYTVTATSQIAGNWRQTYKDWLGGGQSSSASGVVSSSGGSSTAAIGWPDKAVQFNRSGSLGGSDQLLADPDGSGDGHGYYDLPAVLSLKQVGENQDVLALYKDGYANKGIQFQLASSDVGYIFTQLAGGFYIYNYDGDIAISQTGGTELSIDSGADIDLTPGDPNSSYYGELSRLWAVDALCYETTETTNNLQLDPSSSVLTGSAVFRITTARTATLPPLFLSPGPPGNWNPRVNPNTNRQRSIRIKNHIASTANLTVAGHTTYSDTIDGAASLVLRPGESIEVQAYVGTNPGWRVFNRYYPPSGAITMLGQVTLTDAQVKALHTTPVTAVSAPGSGYRLLLSHAQVVCDFSAGAYTNVDASAYLVLGYDSDEMSNYLFNDSGLSETGFTDVFGTAADTSFVFREWQRAYDPADGSDWGNVVLPKASHYGNEGLRLVMVNGASGDLTGGNAANTLTVRVYGSVVPVP